MLLSTSRPLRPRPLAFVLMPFDPTFDDEFELGIKAACSTVGIDCERSDTDLSNRHILNRLYEQIADADIIIADMTGRNANVFYEVGYAHALKKHVILLTKQAADIPFDLAHYPHITHAGRVIDLRDELEKKLRWVKHNPTEAGIGDVECAIFFNGINIEQLQRIPFYPQAHTHGLSLMTSMHHIRGRILYEGDIRLTFAIPEDSRTFKSAEVVIFPKLCPGSWTINRRAWIPCNTTIPLTVLVRIITDYTHYDIDCTFVVAATVEAYGLELSELQKLPPGTIMTQERSRNTC